MDQYVVRASAQQSVNIGLELPNRLERVAQADGLDATAAARRIIEAHVSAREHQLEQREPERA
jgi:hypothetical protein